MTSPSDNSSNSDATNKNDANGSGEGRTCRKCLSVHSDALTPIEWMIFDLLCEKDPEGLRKRQEEKKKPTSIRKAPVESSPSKQQTEPKVESKSEKKEVDLISRIDSRGSEISNESDKKSERKAGPESAIDQGQGRQGGVSSFKSFLDENDASSDEDGGIASLSAEELNELIRKFGINVDESQDESDSEEEKPFKRQGGKRGRGSAVGRGRGRGRGRDVSKMFNDDVDTSSQEDDSEYDSDPVVRGLEAMEEMSDDQVVEWMGLYLKEINADPNAKANIDYNAFMNWFATKVPTTPPAPPVTRGKKVVFNAPKPRGRGRGRGRGSRGGGF